MSAERTQAKNRMKSDLVGAVTGLALVASALFSLGGSPTTYATPLTKAGKPEAARVASTAPERVSPGEAVADRDTLDLQLD